MKVFTCNDADGYFSSPSMWVVVAADYASAREALNAAIKAADLDPSRFELIEIDTSSAAVHALTIGEC